jgi:hypothetical protein
MKIMKSFLGKPRKDYPWLKGRINLGDCAAGYARVATGKHNKIIWVSELVKLMKKNGTWKKGKPKMGDAVIYDWNGDGGCDHVAMFHSKTKNGLWVAYGANQGDKNVVTKLMTSSRPILGWGTPFEFAIPEIKETEVIDATGEETAETKMPLRPEHYETKETTQISTDEILAYQIKKGLPQTGILDDATKERMNK